MARAAEGDELADVLAQPVYGSTRIASASKYDQDAADTPSMAYVRTGGEIRAQGYRTLAEVLESMPGVHLRNDRAYTYTGVRGISRPGDYSSRLLLLIDGVRVNESIYDSATGGREFPLDIGLIDRVEYVPGPGSALYGSNAVLGVVNVVTRNPSQLPGWTTTLEAASFGGRKLALTWAGNAGPARILFGAASERNRGHARLYYPEYDAADTNGGVAEDRDRTRNDKLFVKALWQDFRFTAEVSDHQKLDPTGSFGAIFNRRSLSADRSALTDLAYARPFGADHEVFARIGLADYRYYGYGEYGDTGAIVPAESVSKASWLSGELRYVWSGWAGHRILIGTEFQNNFRQYLGSADLEPASFVYIDERLQSSRWSLFVNDEWQLTDTLRLNLGVRTDRRLDREHAWTPRVSALWSPSPQWTFKLQHGSAFREPNASETTVSNASQVPSQALTVESTRSNEWSALWRPQRGLDLSATYYALDIRDSIVLVAFPDGTEQYRNTGRLRSRGLELEATQVFANGLLARASWSRQEGIDRETGATLSDSPRSLVKLMVTAPGPWAGARVGANLLRVGERRTLANAPLAPYVRLNAQLTHAPTGQPWSLGVGLYNLTGSRYADPSGPEHLQDAIAQDGRGWRVQLAWVF